MTEQIATYYLVDGSIYIFQSHFSPHVECFDIDGNDLSAVYGFTQFLLPTFKNKTFFFFKAKGDLGLK